MASVNRSIIAVEAVENLRQDGDRTARKTAMRTFAKNLRRRHKFHTAWEAVGGAQGLAGLMSEFSVQDVRMLCGLLGRTGPATNAQEDRRAGLSELFHILSSGSTDARPLRSFYQTIIPACDIEVIESWESKVQWTRTQTKILWQTARQQREQQFLKDLFSKSRDCRESHPFRQNWKFFRSDLSFCETILVKAARDCDQYDIHSDFIPDFVMPLLKKLSKRRRRSLRDRHNNFLDLVVECFKAHPRDLKSFLQLKGSRYNDDADTMIPFVLKRMRYVPEDRKFLSEHLQTLLKLAPTDSVWIPQIYDALNSPFAGAPAKSASSLQSLRCEVLRIFLLHCDEYRVDIKNMSPAAEARIVAATKRHGQKKWPAALFLSIPVEESLALFEKMEQIHQGQSFISTDTQANSILCQKQGPDKWQDALDLDIIRTVLWRTKDPKSMEWASRLLLTLEGRKKKATESREHGVRAFWAKSALRLCIAGGDLQMLQETFNWARRFVKDPLAGPEIFGAEIINSPELKSLLIAVPVPMHFENPKCVDEVLSTAKQNIATADRVLLSLLDTACSTVSEPSFKASHWSHIISLPKKVAEGRVNNARSLARLTRDIPEAKNPETDIAKFIWAPTIDSLLGIEAFMSDPAALKAAGKQSVFAAGQFMAKLPDSNPSLLAELTTQFLEGMKARLAPTLVKSHMGHIVSTIVRLTQSTQPGLAIPFVGSVIRSSDSSSSHRQILTNKFLESLPATVAREFVTTTAATILDLMKEQNARPWKEGFEPSIKVTTIKMMAQLLKGNKILDPKLSDEILVSLLKESRHIDARVEIISSLMSILVEGSSSVATRNHIFEVLEEHVLPMASQLNERRPATEDDWHQVEMPEVSENNSIMNLIWCKAGEKGLESVDRDRLLRLLMNALEESALLNERWMNLFIRRHCPNVEKEYYLHTGPAQDGLLHSILSKDFDLLPNSLVTRIESMVLNNLDSGPQILQVTDVIRSDVKLRESNAGKHWLSQFDSRDSEVLHYGLQESINLLRNRLTFGRGEVTVQRLQDFIVSAAQRCVRLGKVKQFSRIMDYVTSGSSVVEGGPKWCDRCAPVIEKVIQIVDQQAQDKTSNVLLPGTFSLRLALIQVPLWHHERPIPEEVIASFAAKLSSLVAFMVATGRPYHEDLLLLKNNITNSRYQFLDNPRVGITLIQLQDDVRQHDPSLAAFLRCEIAATYLTSIDWNKAEDKAVKLDAAQLLREWTASPVNEIRAMGLKCQETLRGRLAEADEKP